MKYLFLLFALTACAPLDAVAPLDASVGDDEDAGPCLYHVVKCAFDDAGVWSCHFEEDERVCL